MRKRRVYAVVIGVAVLVGLMVWVFGREREPEYGGKRLSEWVDAFGRHPGEINWPVGEKKLAEDALRRIGTNALPYLLRWIRFDSPPWKSNLYRALNPALTGLNPRWVLSDQMRVARANGALFALRKLGPEAEGAVGQLTMLMADPKAPQTAERAVGALRFLGATGLEGLLLGLTNERPRVRLIAATGFALQGTNARSAVPALLPLLNDADLQVRTTARHALLNIDPEALERGTP